MSSPTVLNLATPVDYSKVHFSGPKTNQIPNSTLTYDQVDISYQEDNGALSKFYFTLPEELFSFGVQENKDPTDPTIVKGYTLPICLVDRQNQTDEQTTWIKHFDELIEHIKDKIIDNKEDYGLDDLTRPELRNINPIFRRKTKDPKTGKPTQKIDPTGTPTLYPKLIYYKAKDQFITQIMNYDNVNLNPLDLIGKRLKVSVLCRLESIFIGSKLSLRITLQEAFVDPINYQQQNLLKRPSRKKVTENNNPLLSNSTAHDSDSDSEDETNTTAPAAQPKSDKTDKTVKRKVIKKVIKKKPPSDGNDSDGSIQ